MSKSSEIKAIVGEKVEQLKQQETHLSSLSDLRADCIILHDLNGDIIEANHVALEYLGYEMEEMAQLNLKDLQPKTKRDSDKAPIALEIYNDAKVDITRTVFVRKNGSRFPADVKTSYIRFNHAGQLITVVQRVFRDMEKSKERAAQHQNDQGVSPDPNERVDFLSLLQKQLKSPVDEMLSAIKLLGSTEINQEQESLLRLTENTGSFLINVINDTMDLLKVGSDKIKISQHSFNLSHLIEEVVEVVSPSVLKKGLELSTYIDADISEYVQGDEARLRQILTKLIGNAVQLSEKGEIKLEVNFTSDRRIRFEVMDSGEGIDEEEQNKLFTNDFLQNFTISRRYDDVALGYALARRLVILMEGDFGFSSQRGEGSLFWFSLDMCSKEYKEGSPDAKYKFLSNQSIVFIDYADESRNELQRQLKSWGADLQLFDSEEKAAAFFAGDEADKINPILIILNAHRVDGSYAALVREVNNYLHREQHSVNSHFVIITPGDFVPQTARHFARISHTIVEHPLKIGPFANKLARLICVDEPYEVTPWETGQSKIDKPEKLISGRVLVADDGIVTQKATAMILKKYGLVVDCVSNGIEAIDAVEKQHYDVVLMDVVMPEMDGIEATKRIRKLENHTRHTPILAITASMKDEVWRDCVYAGVDDYMTKPIEPREMVATIEYWMGTNKVSDPFNIGGGRSESKNEVEKDVPAQSELLKAIQLGEAVNKETILQLQEDTSPEITKEMVYIFVQETEERITRLRSAFEASNFDGMVEEAHTLISSSGTFGANWLKRLAQSLEEQAKHQDNELCVELIEGLPSIFQHSCDQLEQYASTQM